MTNNQDLKEVGYNPELAEGHNTYGVFIS